MSLFEVLDRFVATGALACAGLVGARIPSSSTLDGDAFSRQLRDSGWNEPFGAALDALAHAVWFARERRGIPLEFAERHAAGLTAALSEVRFTEVEIVTAIASTQDRSKSGEGNAGNGPGHRLAELWLVKAKAAGALTRADLDIDVSRFLLEELFGLMIERGLLLTSLAPAIVAYCARGAVVSDACTAFQSAAPQRSATSSPEPPANPAANGNAGLSELSCATVSSRAADGMMPEGAGRRFKAILAQQPMSAEQRLARLDELCGWVVATIAHLRKPSNEAPELRAAKLEAAAALEVGDLERAMDRLKWVREQMRDSRRKIEARISDELQSLRHQMAEEAAATARLGEVALARMDLLAAADHFADAAGQLPAGDGAAEIGYRLRQAEALAAHAEATGDIRSIEGAAQAFRTGRGLITAAIDARTRVRLLVGLGDMAMAIAARCQHDVFALEEAVAAYANAVAAIDQVAKPMQWALVQLSHASALIELGNRRDRGRHVRLAASALMPALEIFDSRGATDLAEAARAKLRDIATLIEGPVANGRLIA